MSCCYFPLDKSQTRRKYLQIRYVTVSTQMHKELSNLVETNSLIKTWAKDLSRHLTKEDICMASKPMKAAPPSVAWLYCTWIYLIVVELVYFFARLT